MEMFVYSEPRPSKSAKVADKTGCFTTLPIRIHKRNDIADAASHKMIEDWGKYISDGWEKASHASLNPTDGNLCSYLFPEALPERLGVLTYLTDLGLFHDDACEDMEVEEAIAEHEDLIVAMDIGDKLQLSKESSTMQKKRMLSQALLECIELDREHGIEMLDIYRHKWLAVMEHTNTDEFLNLDQYLAFRILNGGAESYFSMVEFSMGVRISAEDKELTKDIHEATLVALFLTNDYFSWDRELEYSKKVGAGRIVNAIAVLMKQHDLQAAEAKEMTKHIILQNEAEYVRRRDKLYEDHPSLPFYLRRWIEVWGVIIAGNHVWSSTAPRHNDWKNSPERETKRVQDQLGNQVSTSTTSTAAASSSDEFDAKKHAQMTGTFDSSQSISDNTSTSRENQYLKEGPQSAKKRRFVNKEDNLSHGSPNKKQKHINSNGAKSYVPNGVDLANGKVTEQGILGGSWYQPAKAAIFTPIDYITSMPSKGVRSSMIEAMNFWFRARKQDLNIITEVVDMLHNSSLILDDIEDSSPLRRGKPSVHVIFGEGQAINSANFMYVLALKAVQKLQNPKALTILLDELENLHLGQSWDLYWKHNLVCPTEAEYLNMIDNKTGGMFRMLGKLMEAQTSLTSTFDFDYLNLLFGRFFQIRDDYMNLRSGEYSTQKGICEDLDEGKISYLVVHCLTTQPKFKDHVLGLFRRPTSASMPMQQEHKQHILGCMEATGTFDHTLDVLTSLEESIDQEIGRLEEATGEKNPLLRLLVTRLSVVDLKKGRD